MPNEQIIPKVIYQTWKSNDKPSHLEEFHQEWKRSHNESDGWEHKFLLDEDLRNLVKDNFPEYLDSYDGFTHTIERVDFSRYVMMYLGGVYADLDTYPVKNIEPFLSYPVVLGREPLDHSHRLYNREVVLCNAFMMSEGNKNSKVGRFWKKFMDFILDNYEHNSMPVYTTGPMAMTLFYEKYPELFDSDILITEPCVFFPMQADNTISEDCDFEKDTYVVHVWENSWSKNFWENPVIFNGRYWFWGLLFVFLIFWMLIYVKYRKNSFL